MNVAVEGEVESGDKTFDDLDEDLFGLDLPPLVPRGKFGMVGGHGGGGKEDQGGGDLQGVVVQRLVVDSIDPALRTNDIKSLLSRSDFPPLGGSGFILDRSLERVFG